MIGVALARELALLGAECAVAAAHDPDADPGAPWPTGPRWTELGARMRAHLDAPDALAERLVGGLGLPALDYWLVVLCAAAELHTDAAAACSLVADDERIRLPTAQAFARLAQAALDAPVTEGALTALGGAALAAGLVEAVDVAPGRPHAARALRLGSTDLARLLADPASVGRPALPLSVEPPVDTPVFPEAPGAAALLGQRGLLCLRALSPRGAAQLALDVASVRGEPAIFVPVGETPPEPGVLRRATGGLLVLDFSRWPAERPLPLPQLDELAASRGAVIALVGAGASTGRRACLDARPLDWPEARRVWERLLSADDAAWLGDRFRLTVPEARAALVEARDQRLVAGTHGEPAATEVAERVLALGARGMGRLVTPLRTPARLEQLVVPPATRAQMDDIVAWCRAAPRARAALGGTRLGGLGRGLACLFSGSPGTGKTFAAQCLANELGLNLYRIDLSQVVSKYIGETEKALSQVFDEAEAGHGVLLFDEADALFGKRSEVKDAHDRYANIEVGYLLQRMETFDGVAILTTNMRANLDVAFTRRLRFLIEFPLPDRDARARLWEQSLPEPAHRDPDLAIAEFVDRFRLSGGNIHNIGVAATHLAFARPDGRLRTEHLVRATYRELEKSGVARSRTEFGPLARFLPGKEAACT